jgi:NAD(P)-dependent dehydrogenase (short-subunit alcohol dehydrogenase family)
VEFAGASIRVNALCPGFVSTPLWDGQLLGRQEGHPRSRGSSVSRGEIAPEALNLSGGALMD